MRALILVASALFATPSLGQAPQTAPEGETSDEAPDPAAEEARILFDHGRELAEDRRYAEAIEAFRQSLAAHPRPSTRFNLALCLFALGRHVEALDALETYVNEAPPEEAEGVTEARRLMTLAQGRLATLAVETVPSDAQVSVDGEPLRGAVERLDPGVHVLRVEALDHAPQVLRLDLAPAERRRELVRLESTRRPARLTLRTDRPATLFLDGARRSELVEERLDPGEHRLRVEAPGARWTRRVTLEAGDRFELDLTLPPAPPPPRQWWQKPWPWLAAGAVVVGGVVAAILLGGRTADPSGGSTDIVLEAAQPTSGAAIVP